ncbi:MAG: Spy/CpxP family protein refolding chaperone [Acidobacteriota bacterium]
MKTAIARHVVFALAAVLLGGGAAAAAQGPGPAGPMMMQRRPPIERAMGGRMGRWWNNPRMIDQLKLTDEQRKDMDQIWYQHREKLIDLQANLQRAELAMQPLMSADQPDRAAMEAQIDKVVAARGDLERANSRFLLDIRMKLSAGQWKQLKDLRSQRGMMRGGPGRGPMWNRRPGGQAPPMPPANPPASPQGQSAPPQ